MIRAISILFMCVIALACKSQEKIQVEKVNDTSLTKTLTHIRRYQKYNGPGIAITLLLVSNPSGSAETGETDEVTDNLYLAVSEFDENPKTNLFIVKNLFGADEFTISSKLDNPNEITVRFSFLDRKLKHHKMISLFVTIDKVVFGN